jgi:HK97 family phage portal protein
MSRRRAAAPSLMQRLRGALSRGRPRASQHVKDITTSEELARAMSAGVATDSGISVSPDSAMRVNTVWACVRIISNAIAMCPLILYRREGAKEIEAEGHAVHHLLKYRPNRFQTAFQFKQLLMFHLLLRGNSTWFKGLVGGRPDELFPMHPDQTQVYRWSELEWQYYYSPYNGGFQIFEPWEVVHVRGMSSDGIEGIGVVEHARQSIGLAAATEKHGAKLFGSGAQVPMVLEMGPGQKLSKEARELLQEDFAKKYAGLDNAYKVPIIEEGMKLTKLALTSEESQFVDSRKMSRQDICMWFGVAEVMLGVGEKTSSWGTGIEQMSIGFVRNVLRPWMKNIEEELCASLLTEAERPFYSLRFDTEELVRGDFKNFVDALKVLREMGALSANDVRSKLGMNPRDDEFGDDFMVPTNFTSQVVNGGNPTVDRGRLMPNDPTKALPAPQQRTGT